jgi:hypothetical protein
MIAPALSSMSAAVVAQPEMLIRMAGRPCHTVGPHQHVPSSWTAAIRARVWSSVAARTSTWLSTRSLSTSRPAWPRWAAIAWAWRQVRVMRSVTPGRPSVRSTAHTSTGRARWEDWGVEFVASKPVSEGR